MNQNLKNRVIINALVVIVSLFVLAPSFFDLSKIKWWDSNALTYGLDIQGGLQLVMGVDVPDVIKKKLTRSGLGLKDDLAEKGVVISSVDYTETPKASVVLEFSESNKKTIKDEVMKQFGSYYQIINQTPTTLQLAYLETVQNRISKEVVDQAIEVIRNRIDEFGVSEPVISTQGTDRILVQLPGLEDSAKAKSLVNRTARLEFMIVSEDAQLSDVQKWISEAEKEHELSLGGEKGLTYTEYVKQMNLHLKDKLPAGNELVFQRADQATSLEAGRIPVLVKNDQTVGGEDIDDAFVGQDEFGSPVVQFRMSVNGRKRFGDLTGANIKKPMAIVLDKVVQSSPVIQSKISAQGSITLGSGQNYNETFEEARFIATTLRSGALPARLETLEERTVGPTLGADSINAGKKAGLVGAVLVLLFMLLYYRDMGVIANIALTVNVILLLALLASLGATLTLPGVAGIVLTVGMAVDANVIIFERVREEIRKGVSTKAAIKDGFGHALSAILDANITTAAVCFMLIAFGTGPVKGFAVTLICGIVTSMFTAIFLTRTLMDLYTNMKPNKNWIKA